MGNVISMMVFVDVPTTYVEVSTVLLGAGVGASTGWDPIVSHSDISNKACTVTAEDLDLDALAYLPGL